MPDTTGMPQGPNRNETPTGTPVPTQGNDASDATQPQESKSPADVTPSSSSENSTPASAQNTNSATDAIASSGEQIDYHQLYESIKDKPCKVVAVRHVYEEDDRKIRTKQHIIDRELDRVLKANSLEEIRVALEDAGKALQQLGIFNQVGMLVNEEPEDDPEACTVLVDLEEKNWYRANAASYFQGNENTVEVGFGLNNPTGNAEHVSFTAEYGTQSSTHFSLNFDQTRPKDLPISIEAHIQQYLRNHVKLSSYSERMRGLLLGVRSLDSRHAVQYELGWRSVLVDVTSSGASRAVAAQAGDFLKAAAKYTFMLDKRQQSVCPTHGWAVKSSTEVAGLGPDQTLRYIKQQLDGQYLLPVTKGVTLSLSASAGALAPWGGAAPLSRPTCIADRFFLGGQSTLRGFKFNGAGPTDERRSQRARLQAGTSADSTAQDEETSAHNRDALGGDLYASVLAQILFALPGKAAKSFNLHAHVFANGGNCDLLAGTGKSWSDGVKQFCTNWRWSCGAGLVLPTWFGRFEANYVHVLSAQEHDRVKRGFQLGFAANNLSG